MDDFAPLFYPFAAAPFAAGTNMLNQDVGSKLKNRMAIISVGSVPVDSNGVAHDGSSSVDVWAKIKAAGDDVVVEASIVFFNYHNCNLKSIGKNYVQELILYFLHRIYYSI